MESGYPLFIRMAPYIATLPAKVELQQDQLLTPQFLLHQEGRLSVYYLPFEYVNTQAKVVLVGITPGWTQMQIAYQVARDALQRSEEPKAVCDAVDRAASFAGSMRMNLTIMLDALNLPYLLGVDSSAQLFDDRRDSLHTTSIVRYPVFRDGANYTGHTPSLCHAPLLLRYALEVFAPEMAQIEQAIIVPLGKAVSDACVWLIEQGFLDGRRCLIGFPHPSGANGHRIRQFRDQRDELQQRLTAWFTVNRD